jgi:hypothetical protein
VKEATTFENEIRQSVTYLNSEQALKDIVADPYWPKWNSPWWHMLLLYEMGETSRIPRPIIDNYIVALNRMPLKIFPIYQNEMPEGVDPYRESPCHCQLGNAYQVLAKWGVDVDDRLPWLRPWFLKYQMSDGGLNCDNGAYLVQGEAPSSMVGTIAAFEAILYYTKRAWTAEEKSFLDKGAQFLMKRKLMLGSDTEYNASERKSAAEWTKLCFPRFYFYDVLRGLNALLAWSEKTGQEVPAESIKDVVAMLKKKAAGEMLRNERHSYDGVETILPTPAGEWIRRQPATFFPLLESISVLGEESPFLSKQWLLAKTQIATLSIV